MAPSFANSEGASPPCRSLPPRCSASRRTAAGWAPRVRGEQSEACAGKAGARTSVTSRELSPRVGAMISTAAATAPGPLPDLELALDRPRDLILPPLHGPLGGHAVHRLGHHVGQDVVVVHALRGVARLGGPAARVGELRLLREH